MKLNVITLFSGYDSQCLALNRLKRHNPQFDYDLVAWAEIDPHAIKAHNALFPQWADRNLGDVSKVDWQAQAAALGCNIDLLTYSSPCQDFSQAGLQRGGEKGSGTRSSLLWECERAIETLRPKYLLMENVAALVTQKFLPLFNRWQGVLEKLGYTNYAQILNSKNYGVPQNRGVYFSFLCVPTVNPLLTISPNPFRWIAD
jgi:DNA (cytosine-5)-methyltransferase 1